eukprot:CAMPEP_0114292858 /NCGR_PEP_ID=MMETSP0059-20121206/9289_1 /TAXON_ID=36894 /ORGANISM="Pyramimonas parkeae, Strain CCMP726" /LENGTH=64 /DNA_ID=CAMNT_0001414541 /DNA_START=276 /DNA_END=470 /DNA_ORIENTATION=+
MANSSSGIRAHASSSVELGSASTLQTPCARGAQDSMAGGFDVRVDRREDACWIALPIHKTIGRR